MVLSEIFATMATEYGLTFLDNIYTQALFIMFVFLILGAGVLPIISRGIKKITEKTETDADDLLYAKTKEPIFVLVFILGLWLALKHVDIHHHLIEIFLVDALNICEKNAHIESIKLSPHFSCEIIKKICLKYDQPKENLYHREKIPHLIGCHSHE